MSRRAIAVLTIGAGALLVVLGSLFPLYGVETIFRPGPAGVVREANSLTALTGWEFVQEPQVPRSQDGGRFPVYGYGLVLGAVLAGIGAVLQLRSPLLAAIGRFAVLAGFGVVVGALWSALETLRTLFSIDGTATAIATREQFVGAGTWLIGLAAVALLVGVVLAQDWPLRLPRPTGVSVYQVENDDTPPFGIAIPVSELDVPPGDPVPPDERRHPTGGNSSTVD